VGNSFLEAVPVAMLQYSQLFKAQLKALAWDLAKAGQLHQLCKALNKGRKDTL
jgi:hypothetical protein